VSRASVRLPGGETRAIGKGLLIYLGVGKDDEEQSASRLVAKIANLRIFSNADNKFDRSLLDEKGSALVISQFTLFADAKSGRRPDFTAAAHPDLARPLCERFIQLLCDSGVSVATGEFGAHMEIDSLNDGPVTIWLDSDSL
jgi:D-tyrosyl-tRNA(Tyr) deacylase